MVMATTILSAASCRAESPHLQARGQHDPARCKPRYERYRSAKSIRSPRQHSALGYSRKPGRPGFSEMRGLAAHPLAESTRAAIGACAPSPPPRGNMRAMPTEYCTVLLWCCSHLREHGLLRGVRGCRVVRPALLASPCRRRLLRPERVDGHHLGRRKGLCDVDLGFGWGWGGGGRKEGAEGQPSRTGDKELWQNWENRENLCAALQAERRRELRRAPIRFSRPPDDHKHATNFYKQERRVYIV